MAEHRRARLIATSIGVVVLVVVALAFALGGQHSSTESGGPAMAAPAAIAPQQGAGSSVGSTFGVARSGAGSAGASNDKGTTLVAGAVPSAMPSAAPDSASTGTRVEPADDSVTATRVVKTGSMDLRVGRNKVQSTVSQLGTITKRLGGYVSESRTESILGSPDGEVTLRIPAAHFDDAVTAAQGLGRVTSLTTNAHDVTGQFVDLGARLSALQQTRTTYLTILGHAKTIGSTLEVQQRIDDVQQQIEELQGQLKVLRNQSADGTLTISVSQAGAATTIRHHKHNGIGAAWHRSIDRFARGSDAIVGALGPLLLALIVLGVLTGLSWIGYRVTRRAASETAAPASQSS